MTDTYEKNQSGLESPAVDAFAITASDVTDFANVTRGIYTGAGGDIAVVFKDDTVLTFVGTVAGSILPVRAKRVNSTNTAATGMIGLY